MRWQLHEPAHRAHRGHGVRETFINRGKTMRKVMTAAERKANWNGMNWIRQEKRLAIYMRDGMACAYCGEGVEHGASLQLDHVLAVERGGANEATNLVTCCDRCNQAKGDRQLAEFIRATAAYLNHGVSAFAIHKHVLDCLVRPLPIGQAKVMIEKRGSAARALAHIRENNREERQ